MKLIGRVSPDSTVTTNQLVVYPEARAFFRKGMLLQFGLTDDGKMMRAGSAVLVDVIGFRQLSLVLDQNANCCVPAIAPGDYIFEPGEKPRRVGDLSGKPPTKRIVLRELLAYRRMLEMVYLHEAHQIEATEIVRLTRRLDRVIKRVEPSQRQGDPK